MSLELREKANKDKYLWDRNGWQELDLGLWSRNEATIIAVEEPQSPRANKVWQVRSSTKSTLIVFFNVKGIVHPEFVPPNSMNNSDFYYDILRHLRENVWWKIPELRRNHNWLLHHDNMPAHTSLKTTEFVTNNMVILPPPPYSLDLATCDFALFPKMKLKGWCF
jgi:hypothetical protein